MCGHDTAMIDSASHRHHQAYHLPQSPIGKHSLIEDQYRHQPEYHTMDQPMYKPLSLYGSGIHHLDQSFTPPPPSSSVDVSPYSEVAPSPSFESASPGQSQGTSTGHNYQQVSHHQVTSSTPSPHPYQHHNGPSSSSPHQQRNPFIGRSACVVCGDRARGCNFGAITCASCKEFFRRNAFKLNKLKCYFQNKCDINIYSRRFCAACRLSKCYQMGMKSEYIMSETEKYERQMKIIERKLSTKSRLLALNVHGEMEFDDFGGAFQGSNQAGSGSLMDLEDSLHLLANQNFYHNGGDALGMLNPFVKEETMDSHQSGLLSPELLDPLLSQLSYSPSQLLPFANLAASLAGSPINNTTNSTTSSHHSNQIMHSHSTSSMDNSLSSVLSSTAHQVPSFISNSPAGGNALMRNSSLDSSSSPQSLNSNPIDLIQSSPDEWFQFGTVGFEEKPFLFFSEPNKSSPPPPSPSAPLDEPEVVRKLFRKVKIIRESSFYPTKFQLLVRAHSAEKILVHHEICKLKYLTSIVQIMQAEIITELPTDQKCIDLIRIAETVTFCFIKMCKKLYAFQALNQEDQVELVKGRVVETLILWSVMTINLEKECWEALDLERNIRFSLKLELLKEANPKLYHEHRKYAMSFEPEWRFNDNLMSLLIAIALFNTDRADISNMQIIRNEKKTYCDLLKRYLATLYEKPLVEDMYNRLLKQLELTEQISESHVKAYFDVSPNEISKNGIGGIIMEIFDLNS